MHILIAEDDKFLASAYRVKFTKLGWVVNIASSGQEVLDAVTAKAPDLIVLDLIMPDMDGFEALEKLKTVANFKNVPVLVASNLGQKEDINRAIGLGASDYIVKSEMSLDTIIEKIKLLVPSAK